MCIIQTFALKTERHLCLETKNIFTAENEKTLLFKIKSVIAPGTVVHTEQSGEKFSLITGSQTDLRLVPDSLG